VTPCFPSPFPLPVVGSRCAIDSMYSSVLVSHGLDGQHQYVIRLSVEVNQNNRMTQINGESTSKVWPTLGSRTAKKQNRTATALRSQTSTYYTVTSGNTACIIYSRPMLDRNGKAQAACNFNHLFENEGLLEVTPVTYTVNVIIGQSRKL